MALQCSCGLDRSMDGRLDEPRTMGLFILNFSDVQRP